MWCEVADDPVVVSKSRPVKPGNRVEDKTAMTSDAPRGDSTGIGSGERRIAKSVRRCEGVKFQGSVTRREIDPPAAPVKIASSGTVQAVPGETALLDRPADAE